MNLHEDKDVFSELIGATAESLGLPEVYIEKDYWVTKALKYLSESACVNDVVFKGGTSLSKAYRLIDRFSEDIDLAVFSQGKSPGARKKLLKRVEGIVAEGLRYLENDARESKGSTFRRTAYQYPRHIVGDNFGQASTELLIEVNMFSHPEPFEARVLQTLVADMLLDRGQTDLIERFGLYGFSINVLSVRRTLVEKILGLIKDSYSVEPATKISNRIRHLYDICLILRDDEYRGFVASDKFKFLCDVCVEDESQGAYEGADYLKNSLTDAPLFSDFKHWRKSLEPTYNGGFSDLVYGDLPEMEEIAAALKFVHKYLS